MRPDAQREAREQLSYIRTKDDHVVHVAVGATPWTLCENAGYIGEIDNAEQAPHATFVTCIWCASCV